MTTFSIKQLTSHEWETYKHIRLEALKNHPQFFCPSSDEFNFSEQDWRDRLTNETSATFGLYDNENIIGLTGIFQTNNDPNSDTALMVASYIKKEYRNKGLSKLLYEARLNWAKNIPKIKILEIGHREDNILSKKANQKFGFKFVKSEEILWPDGQKMLHIIYQLKL